MIETTKDHLETIRNKRKMAMSMSMYTPMYIT
jgi:hypothetical protein